MVTYFAENLDGFAISGLVRSYGNRYYRKPIATGPIKRRQPVTLDTWKYAQSLTEKPVKGMLTGPYTICDWSFDEYFPNREAFIMNVAEFVRDEARDLEAAGATYIQIDEPALSTRPEEIDVAIRAMGVVTEGLTATTITHICYGDFAKIYPRMLDMPVDIFDLEMANSGYQLMDVFASHPFRKMLSARRCRRAQPRDRTTRRGCRRCAPGPHPVLPRPDPRRPRLRAQDPNGGGGQGQAEGRQDGSGPRKRAAGRRLGSNRPSKQSTWLPPGKLPVGCKPK